MLGRSRYLLSNFYKLVKIDGLDWLMNKWYNLTSVILADDMGLGKTVQIAAFLGLLGSKKWNIYPSLVVVPNSTLQSKSRTMLERPSLPILT
jgi:SNF2 family DNA or RNA helicase